MEDVSDLESCVTHRTGSPLRRDYSEPAPTPPFSDLWRYPESDPALMLFTAAVSRFNLTFPPGSRILELGCAESDWLERMHKLQQGYDLVGVDARREEWRAYEGITFHEGSAMDPDLFQTESFDRIVLLGALEHFGLGFYGDPVHEDGDIVTMQNIARWLRPGGFVYFDVPVQPSFKVSDNRHFRMYAPADIEFRLIRAAWESRSDGEIHRGGMRFHAPLVEVNRGYSLPEPNCGTWCHEPTSWRTPYWFVAVLAQKLAAD